MYYFNVFGFLRDKFTLHFVAKFSDRCSFRPPWWSLSGWAPPWRLQTNLSVIGHRMYNSAKVGCAKLLLFYKRCILQHLGPAVPKGWLTLSTGESISVSVGKWTKVHDLWIVYNSDLPAEKYHICVTAEIKKNNNNNIFLIITSNNFISTIKKPIYIFTKLKIFSTGKN